MAHCPSCQYVFCTMCRQGFHGIEPCKISKCNFFLFILEDYLAVYRIICIAELKKICIQYKNGDAEVREKLQKRYGSQRIKQAIEEYQSMDLIERTSKQCPKCKTWMQVELVLFDVNFKINKKNRMAIRNWMVAIR